MAWRRFTIWARTGRESEPFMIIPAAGKENKSIEWCCVRPDSLINAEVSPYDITESPTTGIINGRPTARSNVAHFMTDLIENE